MAHRSAQYRQTIPENFLPNANLVVVTSQLSEDDRKIIETSCGHIEDSVQQKRRGSGSKVKAMLGRGSSMEILSKLGIFMIAQERAEGDPNKLNLRKPSVMADLINSVS